MEEMNWWLVAAGWLSGFAAGAVVPCAVVLRALRACTRRRGRTVPKSKWLLPTGESRLGAVRRQRWARMR